MLTTMRSMAFPAFVLIVCTSLSISAQQSSKRVDTATGLANSIPGTFGEPLGQVARFAATLVENPGTKVTLSNDEFRLRVTHVNGAELRKPVEIDFGVQTFDEDKLSIRPNVSNANDRAEQLRYVRSGEAIRFLAYETGCFRGVPKFPQSLRGTRSAEHALSSANYGFQFRNRLTILESVQE